MADPKPHQLAKLTLEQSIEYFKIYKQKLAELALVNFDVDVDEKFYGYLDRLVNNEEYMKGMKFDGKRLLRQFITDESSLYFRQKRLKQQ